MRRNLTILFLTFLLTGSACLAESDPGKTFNGRFLVGVRTVDVSGAEGKFAQHINLEDGPRLFELHLDFQPNAENEEGEASMIDRVQLDVDHFGGDPFETLRFSAQKYGRFDLRYNRTKSTYFYEDVILPIEQSTPSLSNAGDFHHFDFDRIRDRAALEIELSEKAAVHFGFDRFTKEGESTTTLDVQRDEFELDRPIDEKLDEYTLGFEYAFGKATLILEERYRDYENAYEVFLPGFSLGENPEDATTLDFFFLDQPYQFESYRHTARLNIKPNPRLLIRAAASLEDLDLDIEADESSQGTDFRGNPFTTDFDGLGEIERETELFDLDLSYLLNDRLALTGGFRSSTFEQEGAFFFADDLLEGFWEIESTSFEGGLSFDVSNQLAVAGGIRTETREVTSGHEAGDLEEEETDHTGFYARLDWRPKEGAKVNASFEDSTYDDPFTLTAATDRQRLRVQGTYQFENGAYVKTTYLFNRYENDLSGWDADRDQFDLRVGCRFERWQGSVNYALAETDRSIDQLITTLPGFGGGQTFDYFILFESEATFLEGRVRFVADESWSFGGDFRFYENEGTFPIEREDLRAFAEWKLPSAYRFQLAWRMVDFEENLFNFNDYEADIIELAVGYHW